MPSQDKMIKPTAVKLYDICVPVFPVLLKHLPHNSVRFNLPRALHGYNTTIACNGSPLERNLPAVNDL